jgi:single-strand DNA-binding protein
MADVSLTIVGTAVREPELRFTQTGQAVAMLGVAVNERKKEGDRWVDGDTTFFNVTLWGTLAENAAASVQKGTRVLGFGKIKSRNYDDKEGNKRTSWDVTCDAFGPDLRWATVQVEKTVRETAPAERSDAPPPVYTGDEGQEPF